MDPATGDLAQWFANLPASFAVQGLGFRGLGFRLQGYLAWVPGL